MTPKKSYLLRLTTLCLLITSTILSFSFAKENLNGELEDLETALMAARLARKRAERRFEVSEKEQPLSSAKNAASMQNNKQEINPIVVASIKTTLKDPFINLLASSELISWNEFRDRFYQAKKALELFELRHKAELSMTPPTTQPIIQQMMPPMQPTAVPGTPKPVMTAPVLPGARPLGIQPIPGTQPQLPTQPALAQPPIAQPPAVAPVVAPVAEEEEEEEEEEVQTIPGTQPTSMPGIRPAQAGTMPGIQPGMQQQSVMPGTQPGSVMPGTQPMQPITIMPGTQPGVQPTAAPQGGMPMA